MKGPGVQLHLQPQSLFEASPGYMGLCLYVKEECLTFFFSVDGPEREGQPQLLPSAWLFLTLGEVHCVTREGHCLT